MTKNKLDSFRAFLDSRLGEVADAISASRDLKLDAAISPSGASPALVSEIARAGPFGAGNAEPFVAAPDVRVAFADIVGRDHVRLRLEGGDGARLDAISFRSATTPLGEGLLASRGKLIHAAGRLRADEWQGRARVQLHLEDAAPAQS